MSVLKPLHIPINPSRWLAVCLFTIVACAGFSLTILPFKPWASVLGLPVLLMLGQYYYRRYVALSHKFSISNIVLNQDGCQLHSASGHHLNSDLAEGHFVSNFLVILHLKVKGRYFGLWLPIFVDSVAPELLRQLKVRLRFPDDR